MTVVINEFETLGEAPAPAASANGASPQATERAHGRRTRMAIARQIRMGRN